MAADFAIEALAEDALLLRVGDGIDLATNARVHAIAVSLREAQLPGITDLAPAYATLTLRFDPAAWRSPGANGPRPHKRVAEAVRAIAVPDTPPGADESAPAPENTIEIPVCYGGEYGPDLGAVASHAVSDPNTIVARHAAGTYTVAMLGFAPGFPYLLGLDPSLHVPRRDTPRTRVPAGSVAIGGGQTGIYPRELPGGWNLIGRTPLVLFDPRREPPCLLGPGDRVRFRAIDAAAFEAAVRDRAGTG